MLSLHPSNSLVQGEAEGAAIELLSLQLPGIKLHPKTLKLGDGASVHVDGYRAGPPAILAEVFAHQGPLKGGQRHKLMSDAFKLLAASRLLGLDGKATLMLVLTDKIAFEDLQRGWRGAALNVLGIEVRVVPLAAEMAGRITAAQARQRMTNETLVGPAARNTDEDG